MSMLNAVIISGMSIVSFIIKHIHFSDRNVMLRSVSDRIDGGSPGVCVWEIGQVLPGLCFFSIGNPSVVQTWAGTDRVDVSVQLLVSFIIVLRYKCRPKVKTCEEILTQFTIIK